MSSTKVETVNMINSKVFRKEASFQGLSFYHDHLNDKIAIAADKNSEVLAMITIVHYPDGGSALHLQIGEDVGLPIE